MKKKSLFVGGALLLTAAFGFSALAVSGIIPTPFAAVSALADETGSAVMAVLNQYPAEGVNLPDYPAVRQIYFTFDHNGDDPISMISGKEITITKDGADLYKFTTGASEYVKVGTSYTNRLEISLPAALTPGEYVVTIPAKTVSGKTGGKSSIEGADGFNAEIVSKFSVTKSFTYSVLPAPGTEGMAGTFAEFTLTYPAGCTVTVNEGVEAKATFIEVNPAHVAADGTPSTSYTDLATYEATAEGNVVTFKAVSTTGITSFSELISRKWDILRIPEGLLTITDGATTVNNAAMELGNYAVRTFTADMLKFEPALDAEGIDLRTIGEIKMTLPEGCKWAVASDVKEGSNNAMITVYTKPYATTACYGFKFKSVSEDGLTYTMVPIVSTSTTAANNNVNYCQAGPSAIRINGNKIIVSETVGANGKVTTMKNSRLDIDAWNLVGLEYDPIFNSTPNNGAVVTGGVSSLSVNFLRAAVVANENAEITLHKDGVLLKAVKAGETVTAAGKPGGAGATIIYYTNLFKDADGNAYTEPGVYEFHVPAGTFQQVGSDWVSNERYIYAYVAKPLEYTASPAEATIEGTMSGTGTVVDFKCTPNADLNSISSVTLTYPRAKKIELGADVQKAISNSEIGRITQANAVKWVTSGTTFSPSTVSGYKANFRYEVVGDNQVKVSFNNFDIATPAEKLNGIRIYQGAFVVTYEEDGKDVSYANPTTCLVYQPFVMNAPVLEQPEPGAPAAPGILSSIRLKASESLYNRAAKAAVATLTNAAGEVIATYHGAENSDPNPDVTAKEDGLLASQIWFHSVPISKEEVADKDGNTVNVYKYYDFNSLPDGEYTFTIAEGALCGGSSSTASLQYFNTTPFSYKINVLSHLDPVSITPAPGSKLSSFSYVTVSYKDEAGGVTGNMGITTNVHLVNPDAEAVFYKDGEPVKTMKGGSSAIQYVGEGMNGEITFVYDAKDVSEKGVYKLVVPEGMFGFENGVTNNAIEKEWTVVGPTKVVSDPADAAIVESLSTITLTFPDYKSVTATSDKETLSFYDSASGTTKEYEMTVSCEGNKATLTYAGGLTAEGKYSLDINAGFFRLTNAAGNTDLNTKISLSYGVQDSKKNVTMTPAPGNVTVDDLQTVTFTLPEGYLFNKMINLNSKMNSGLKVRVYEADENGDVAAYGNSYFGTYVNSQCTGAYLKTQNSCTVSFVPNVAGNNFEVGKKYQVVWLKDALVMVDENGAQAKNTQPLVFRFTVVEPTDFNLGNVITLALPDKADFTADDSPFGSTMFAWYLDGTDYTLNEKAEYAIRVNGDTFCTFTAAAADEYVQLVPEKVDFSYASGAEPMAEENVSTLVFSLNDLLSGVYAQYFGNCTGDYTIVVPEGAIMKGGLPNRAYTQTYHYTAPSYSGDDRYEFTPAAGGEATEVLNTITITFPDSKYVSYVSNGKVTLEGPAEFGSKTATYPTDGNNTVGAEDCKSLTWTFGDDNTSWPFGEYTLTIPANELLINVPEHLQSNYKKGNVPAITAKWTITRTTGVNVLGLDPADSYNVYTVDGAVVRVNATVAEVAALEPGLYIINGKKVLIRK